MIATITMDAVGRLVIPRALRERFGLIGGLHRLEVFDSPEGIVLRPKVEPVPAVRHSSGWVVFQSDESETIDPVRAIEEDRQARLKHISGEK